MSARAIAKASESGAVVVGVLTRKERPWTQAELDYVARNLAARYTYSQIAEGLGRSRSAIAGAVRRMRGCEDAPRVRPALGRSQAQRDGRAKRVDQVAELLAEGFSLTDIAEELGVTRDVVKSAFKKIKARLGPQAV